MSEKELQILLLTYEVNASWWAGFIGNAFLQNATAKYFAWKVGVKFRRFKEREQIRQELDEKFLWQKA